MRPQTVLEFRGVSLQKGEYRILDQIDWKVQQGQIWVVKGLNGSGKSTATKLLMVRSSLRWLIGRLVGVDFDGWGSLIQHQRQHAQQEAFEAQEQHRRHTSQTPHSKPHKPSYEGHVGVGVPHIGWVSTEVHLSLAQRCAAWPTAQVILSGLHGYEQEQQRHRHRHRHHHESDAASSVHLAKGYHAPQPPAMEVPPHLAPLLAEWAALLDLGGPAALGKPFGKLSQGQQKLALIARALIGAPPLVVVDEVCQGLDSRHRALVLSLLDTIGRTAGGWLSMLYVTHHADEALPAVTHVLELEKGRVVFKGTAAEYVAAEEGKGKDKAAPAGVGSGGSGRKGLVQGL